MADLGYGRKIEVGKTETDKGLIVSTAKNLKTNRRIRLNSKGRK